MGSSSSQRTTEPGRVAAGPRRLPSDGLRLVRAGAWAAVAAVVLLPFGSMVLLAGTEHLTTLVDGDVVEAGVNSMSSSLASAVGPSSSVAPSRSCWSAPTSPGAERCACSP